MNNQRGQSLVEVIFGVGILVTVIVAVISLIVKTTGIKSSALDRKRASEMGQVIIENLMEDKKNNPESFWQLNDIGSTTVFGYDGYTYTVDFNHTTEGNCSDTENECVGVTAVINWGAGQEFTVNRFFSKNFMD